MFPMRLKIGPSRNNEWRCCFCLHVRTATTLLGIWHLILHVLALAVLALMMRNHHYHLEKAVSEDVDPAEVDMGALTTVCTLAITLLLVYGTTKGKGSHLLPFFCFQLFDFVITALSVTGYFCYLRSVHFFVNEHWQSLPYRRQLLQLSPHYLSLIVVAAFFVTMLWKAYCISIVWRCYKYLTYYQQTTRSTVHYIMPVDRVERVPEPDYSSLLPDYDAACASAMKQPPPPSYQAAMEAGTFPECGIHVINVPSPTVEEDAQQQQQPQSTVASCTCEVAYPEPIPIEAEQEQAATIEGITVTTPMPNTAAAAAEESREEIEVVVKEIVEEAAAKAESAGRKE
ncbi:PREDICTED: lysosomal-associated transmembrane protein 4B isoform X2 [Nicrophorus vespilloides]|uniref:Lysosomal-associated transmembrane protein 4B isoform X2 n=1 Tax=Nicrophorus vespilloides TaxID=110193 RepID=A0ABM1M1G5_NICVS|nr:PREDICTED: lysosomal-associated transmembrane protein 4B isoform X2 [Nicrophorus vespilloides]